MQAKSLGRLRRTETFQGKSGVDRGHWACLGTKGITLVSRAPSAPIPPSRGAGWGILAAA